METGQCYYLAEINDQYLPAENLGIKIWIRSYLGRYFQNPRFRSPDPRWRYVRVGKG